MAKFLFGVVLGGLLGAAAVVALQRRRSDRSSSLQFFDVWMPADSDDLLISFTGEKLMIKNMKVDQYVDLILRPQTRTHKPAVIEEGTANWQVSGEGLELRPVPGQEGNELARRVVAIAQTPGSMVTCTVDALLGPETKFIHAVCSFVVQPGIASVVEFEAGEPTDLPDDQATGDEDAGTPISTTPSDGTQPGGSGSTPPSTGTTQPETPPAPVEGGTPTEPTAPPQTTPTEQPTGVPNNSDLGQPAPGTEGGSTEGSAKPTDQ